MATPSLQDQINDLMKFVFAPPKTPGKAAIAKALGEDWRKVVKGHTKLTAAQKKEIDNFTTEEVALLKRYMGSAARGGKVPLVKVVPKSALSGQKLLSEKVEPGKGSTNNINC